MTTKNFSGNRSGMSNYNTQYIGDFLDYNNYSPATIQFSRKQKLTGFSASFNQGAICSATTRDREHDLAIYIIIKNADDSGEKTKQFLCNFYNVMLQAYDTSNKKPVPLKEESGLSFVLEPEKKIVGLAVKQTGTYALRGLEKGTFSIDFYFEEVTTKCSTPLNLRLSKTANVARNESVTLSWEKSNDGENNPVSGYLVYKSNSSSLDNPTYVATINNASTTSCTVTAPDALGATIYYYVIAYGSAGSDFNSSPSSSASLTTVTYDAITSAPYNILLDNATALYYGTSGKTTATLSWKSPIETNSETISSFSISNGTSDIETGISKSTTSKIVTLENNKKYYVKAITNRGNVLTSSEYATAKQIAVPARPTLLNPPNAAQDVISNLVFSWDSFALDANQHSSCYYNVYFKTAASSSLLAGAQYTILRSNQSESSYTLGISSIPSNSYFKLKIERIVTAKGGGTVSSNVETDTYHKAEQYQAPQISTVITSIKDPKSTVTDTKASYVYSSTQIEYNPVISNLYDFAIKFQYSVDGEKTWQDVSDFTPSNIAGKTAHSLNSITGGSISYRYVLRDQFNALSYSDSYSVTKITLPVNSNLKANCSLTELVANFTRGSLVGTGLTSANWEASLGYGSEKEVVAQGSFTASTESIVSFNRNIAITQNTPLFLALKNTVITNQNPTPTGVITLKTSIENFPEATNTISVPVQFNYKTQMPSLQNAIVVDYGSKPYYNINDTAKLIITTPEWRDAAGTKLGATATYIVSSNDREIARLGDSQDAQIVTDTISISGVSDLNVQYRVRAIWQYGDSSSVSSEEIVTAKVARFFADKVILSNLEVTGEENRTINGSFSVPAYAGGSSSYNNIDSIQILVGIGENEAIPLNLPIAPNTNQQKNYNFTYSSRNPGATFFFIVKYTNSSGDELIYNSMLYSIAANDITFAVREGGRIGINVDKDFISTLTNSTLQVNKKKNSPSASVIDVVSDNESTGAYLRFMNDTNEVGSIMKRGENAITIMGLSVTLDAVLEVGDWEYDSSNSFLPWRCQILNDYVSSITNQYVKLNHLLVTEEVISACAKAAIVSGEQGDGYFYVYAHEKPEVNIPIILTVSGG